MTKTKPTLRAIDSARYAGRCLKLLCIGIGMMSAAAQAQEIATCRAPEGQAFYHYAGIQKKDSAGWSKDKISKGIFTLKMVGPEALDLLFVDAFNKPISAVQDGARVILLRKSNESIAVLVAYSSLTEIYTFFVEKDGTNRFTMLQSRSGPDVPFPKAVLLVGVCDTIQFPR